MYRLLSVILGALVLLCASTAWGAGVPQKINYQAVLLDDIGDPVTDPVNITFRIHDDAVLAAVLWQQTITGIQPDNNGQFSVILGDEMSPITEDILTGEQRWLGIQVEGDPDEMSPRTEMVSSTYSFRVNTIDGAAAGIIYGPLTIEESLAKAADAEVNVTCSAKSPYSVQISPCNGTVLKALDGSDAIGEWGILAPGQSYIAMTDFSAKAAAMSVQIKAPSAGLPDAFTIANSNGDETFQIESDDSVSSVSFYHSTGVKAASLKSRVGTEGFALFGDTEGDEVLSIEEGSPGLATATWTDYSAKAAGASVSIKAPNAGLPDVFTIANSGGDATFQLESDPSVGASMSFYSTAAKASTKGTEINEQGYFAFGATENETLVAISGASIMLQPPAAKGGDRVIISNDGIYFLSAAKSETTMIIHADGNIVGKGQITLGEQMNNAGAFSNVIGFGNSALADSSTVSGGDGNSITSLGLASVVGGGTENSVHREYSGVFSGYYNTVGSAGAGVVGGAFNTIAGGGNYSFVGAGLYNVAGDQSCVVAGGQYNTAGDSLDQFNTAYSTVGGGVNNLASGKASVVSGGDGCQATGSYSTASGGRGNSASGDYSLCGGGRSNNAAGDYSWVGGRRAKANHTGTFVWGDSTDADFASTDINQFLVRAENGVGVNVDSPTVALDVDGTARLRGIPSTVTVYSTVMADGNGKLWKLSAKSSKRYKENIRDLGVDPANVLQLDPVKFSWKETGQEDIGLIAEDVARLIPELVIYDDENRPDGVKYDKVVIYLLAALKDLKAENDALKAHQANTDAQLSQLTELVETVLARQGDSKSGDDKLTLNR